MTSHKKIIKDMQHQHENHLESAIKQLKYYKSLGDKAIAQLPKEKLFYKPTSESNSIAIIVQHLWGNMLSRWTNFLNEDGEKNWRNRDEEFNEVISNKAELLEKWEAGWACLFNAIAPLNTTDLERIVYIRNQGHTVMEAINRQLCHYPYHVGQMVFLAKMFQNEDWQTLSIAKNQSNAYNQEKFEQPKERKHFTDNL